MKRLLISIAISVLVAAAVGAQSLSVSYVEGDAQVKNGQAWGELVIGESIPAGASVRLGADSYLEIAGGQQTISISQPGTYALRTLITQTRLMKSAGVGSVLSAKLAAFFSSPAPKSSTLGVRAAKAEDNSGMSWVTSDAGVYIDTAKQYIETHEYQKAIDQLKQAVESASTDELPEARYYLGYAYSLAGETREALNQIKGLKPADVASHEADLVVLKGKLLLDTNAFGQDVLWLTSNAAVIGSDSDRAPAYYLLLGLSYHGAGDNANARRNLQKVISLAGSTDLGRTAADLLPQL